VGGVEALSSLMESHVPITMLSFSLCSYIGNGSTYGCSLNGWRAKAIKEGPAVQEFVEMYSCEKQTTTMKT
jgi:hypothetical protein